MGTRAWAAALAALLVLLATAAPAAAMTTTPTRTATVTGSTTPRATLTPTRTRTAAPTRTTTATRTTTRTRTVTATRTVTRTGTATRTRTVTATRTVTPPPTVTRTRTVTPTPRPVHTRQLVLFGNLDASVRPGTTARANAVVTDSLRKRHVLQLRFTKSLGNAWDWDATTTDPAVDTPNPLAAGTITFDDQGIAQTTPDASEGLVPLSFTNGAAAMQVPVQMDLVRGYAQRGSVYALADPAREPRPIARRVQPTTAIAVSGNLPPSLPLQQAITTRVLAADSLGAVHTFDILFWHLADREWAFSVSSRDADVATPNPIGGGSLRFDADGSLVHTPGSPEGSLQLTYMNGAAPASGVTALRVEMDALTSRPQTFARQHNRVVVTGNVDSRLPLSGAARSSFTVYDGQRRGMPIALRLVRDSQQADEWYIEADSSERRVFSPYARGSFYVDPATALARRAADARLTHVLDVDDGLLEKRIGLGRIALKSSASYDLDVSAVTYRAAPTSLRVSSIRA